MACFRRSSPWHTALVVGASGFACGLVAAHALRAAPAPASTVLQSVAFSQQGQPETQPGAQPETQPESQPEAQPQAQPTAEEMAAQMEQMKELSRPVPEHDVLKAMEGDWDCSAKFWMAGPDQPPQTSTGVSRHRVVLGGRYLVQHFELEDFMGEPFEGMGIVGYDRATGTYVNDWVDNWSTGIMSMTGEYDPTAKTMDWRGTFLISSPTGPVEMASHHVVKQVDADTFVMEFWHPGPDGTEHRGGEITYTRKD